MGCFPQVGFLLLLVSEAAAQAIGFGCSLASLDGLYLFYNNGFSVTDNGPLNLNRVPVASAGRSQYDGLGGTSAVLTTSFNGVVRNERSILNPVSLILDFVMR